MLLESLNIPLRFLQFKNQAQFGDFILAFLNTNVIVTEYTKDLANIIQLNRKHETYKYISFLFHNFHQATKGKAVSLLYSETLLSNTKYLKVSTFYLSLN